MHEPRAPIPCEDCPLQKRKGLRPLEPDQLSYMGRFKRGEILLEAGEAVIEQGRRSSDLYTILAGVLMRTRTLDDGRRQIVNFMFPGDLVGLQGSFEEESNHSVVAILPARLCIFPRGRFVELIAEHPQLGYDMTWLAAREESELEEHIVALGQRNARERVVYLAVWLLDRAIATRLADADNRFKIPLTQAQVADMLGLSLVHVNRTLQSLRRDGMVEWKQGTICVPDMEKASEFAQYEMRRARPRPFL